MTSSPLNLVAQTIYDKKGMNILSLDVRGISSLTDFVVIAEGNVEKHVQGVARALIHALDEVGQKPLHVEGLSTGDWVVLDYPGFMIHLFKPGLREQYQLERLWKDAELVDVEIMCMPQEIQEFH